MTARQVVLEPMTRERIAGAIALSRHAGRPHRRQDWQFTQDLGQGTVALEVSGSSRRSAPCLGCAVGPVGNAKAQPVIGLLPVGRQNRLVCVDIDVAGWPTERGRPMRVAALRCPAAGGRGAAEARRRGRKTEGW